MSVEMEQAADAILHAARAASLDELSDVEVDPDGSSSLSEIEDKDGDQDDDVEGSDDLSNVSDEENDSEAETERLEESPKKFRLQKDVVLSSNNDPQVYEHSPSKLHNQIMVDGQDDEEDEDLLSEDDITVNESPQSLKSSAHDEPETEPVTTATSLEESSREDNLLLPAKDTDTRKRKRSIMAGGAVDEDPDEPLRKRRGSIMAPGDEYVIEDDPDQEEPEENSNNISRHISDDEGGAAQEEEAHDEEQTAELHDATISPRKRGRKKKKGLENGIENHVGDVAVLHGDPALNGEDEAGNGDEHEAENEGDDEAEAISRNEEERWSLLSDCRACADL